MQYKYGFLFSDSSPRAPGLVLPAENRGPSRQAHANREEEPVLPLSSCHLDLGGNARQVRFLRMNHKKALPSGGRAFRP